MQNTNMSTPILVKGFDTSDMFSQIHTKEYLATMGCSWIAPIQSGTGNDPPNPSTPPPSRRCSSFCSLPFLILWTKCRNLAALPRWQSSLAVALLGGGRLSVALGCALAISTLWMHGWWLFLQPEIAPLMFFVCGVTMDVALGFLLASLVQVQYPLVYGWGNN